MSNYDFKQLNDKEFEELSNDLLSKRESVDVDRFKPGKDGGVDGRFFALNGGEAIIQSKHWIKSGINALIKRLESDEYPKVTALNPDRYILVTSLELSFANKKKIRQVFSPYIKSESDILGNENLNDLLSKYPDIEKKHYKLWLSSSAVLSIIFNNALTGRSEVKRREIVEAAELYVRTANHSQTFNKLEDNHTVVITGEAGIGKTSLADQLAHFYIANGFELCVIEDDISEAEAAFRAEKSQVFYFDDFLGRNFLTALQGHQDSHIMNFIKRVRNDKTKRFILTSRTTILNQGKHLSDLFDINKFETGEYEIKLDSLSGLDRAKILYNHIWFGELSEDHIDELYKGKRYLQIVRHKNFNPRLISFITDQDRFLDTPIGSYWNEVLYTLENPKDVWANVFDNQIDDLMRIAVCLVVFNGDAIEEDDFRVAFCSLASADGFVTASNANNKFNNTLKNAVGAVLNRTVISDLKSVVVNLFNPSVADFVLARYLSDHGSLVEFFTHLNTTQSIENLESLSKNTALSSEGYLQILKKLGTRKLTSANFKANPTYIVILCRLIIQHSQILSSYFEDQLKNTANIVHTVDISAKHIEDACILLRYLLNSSDKPESQKAAVRFIDQRLSKNPEHEDLEQLYNLALNLDWDYQYECCAEIQKSIDEFWRYNINEMISSDQVLGDFFNFEDEDNAFQSLHDYLTDKLFFCSFSDDEIDAIAEYADIRGQIEANRDAEAQNQHDYEMWKDSRGYENSGPSEDTMINDLFDRS